jgi:large subunit ribosomal protein L3
MKSIIGRKVGMTQLFDERGNVTPVTVIQAGPCFVTQVRQRERDGYSAVQLGYEAIGPGRLSGGQLGHLRRNNLPALRYLREFRLHQDEAAEVEEGQEVTVEDFTEGERVDVVGVSKGRGFAGTIKRHGFSRGPKTHGQSDRMRSPGSIGMCATPGRTLRGMRMSGRMGNQRTTTQNLEVMRVDAERNLLAIKGSVPGARNGILLLQVARKGQGS